MINAHLLVNQPRLTHLALRMIVLMHPGFRLLVPVDPPYHNARSNDLSKHAVKGNIGETQPTSILSMSILPYCFRSSLLACCIASTVAIVFRRFSVAKAADSMLNVC